MLFLSLLLVVSSQDCHPLCSWKCDDPHCDAVCSPVCEPLLCHTECLPPTLPMCESKCAEPVCQIKCPEEPCTSDECASCYVDCNNPECVTRCKSPEPECQIVCDDLICGQECHKPNCPKPKCELVCENPHCAPLVECCQCDNTATPLPDQGIFKPEVSDTQCCSCGDNQAVLNLTEQPVVNNV